MVAESRKVAVLINGNARGVNDRVLKLVSSVVPPEHLYISRSITEGRAVVRRILASGYDVVLTGGGDGTFVQFVTQIRDMFGVTTGAVKMPAVGALKLGTGNALAGLLGCSEPTEEGLTNDYWRARYTALTREMRFIEVEGRVAPFAGVGLDARILNDYNFLKDRSRGTAFEPYLSGGIGYATAIGAFTIPKVSTEPMPHVMIVNDGAPAWRVGPDGRRVGPLILKGETIYKGPMMIASVSRLDGYGYHFRLFPFAYIRDDRVHLRIASIGVVEILTKLHLIWRGEYFSDSIIDFLVDRVTMQADKPLPFQIGGDGEGHRSFIRYALAKEPLQLIDFRTAYADLPVGPGAAKGDGTGSLRPPAGPPVPCAGRAVRGVAP
jgi:diacylglycerol kinase family enzyme